MGIGGIGIWQLLIILAIVIMLFGTKRLRTLGSDMGAAIKGFRSTMKTGDADQAEAADKEPETDKATAEESASKK
jgi:sec-independent protein translocase protein TatA